MPSILYVGQLGSGATAGHRAAALRRLGGDLCTLAIPDAPKGLWGRVDHRLARYAQIGRWVADTNAAVLAATSTDWDIAWLDKPWMLNPATIAALRARTRCIVLFNNDNPNSNLERGLWRLLLDSVQYVDVVVTPRQSSVPLYLAHGARRVRVVDFAFEPSAQFPCEHQANENNFRYEVCFIGTNTRDGAGVRPDRAAFLASLARAMPGLVSVFGDGWSEARGAAPFSEVGGSRFGDAYRQTIWASRINLSLITWAQHDETSHRAFEIAGCGGLLVAERSPRLEECFQEGREALFFTGVEECVAVINSVLENKVDRESIVRAGSARAWTAGYDNETRLRRLILGTDDLKRLFPNLS